MKKIFVGTLVIIICAFAFTMNRTFRSIDNLAYVIALGIDVGTSNNVKISFQIAIPSGSEDTSSGGSSSDSSGKNYTISTVEASSINAAKTLVNSYISKELNLSHCKVVVISETYASQGISDIIYTLTNDIETRPDCNLMISSCEAKSVLENSTPFLESLPSRYYEVISNSSEYTGYSANTKLSEFFSSFSSTFSQPYSILCGVNTGTSTSTDNSSQETNIQKETDIKDGSLQIESDQSGLMINGTAVFYGDKLVGELTAIETLCHLIVTNDLKDCIISIKDPFTENGTMDLSVNLNKSTQNTVDLINGSPYVHTTVNLKANILSMSENSDYSNAKNLKMIEEYMNSYLESEISSYFYKTAKEYKSDIAGLGKKVVGKFLTWDEWNNYNWLSNYQNSFFDVTVKTNVKSGYLLLKS